MPLQAFIFLSVVALIFFGEHLFVYNTIVRFLAVTDSWALLTLRLLFIMFPTVFLFTSVASFRYNNILTRSLYTVSASWIGFAYFFLGASLSLWIGYGVAKLVHTPFNAAVIGSILFGVAIVLGIYGLINAATPTVTHITIPIKNLPQQWKGRTAVWVSDIHLGEVRNLAFAEKVAKLVQDQHADAIFIGGDLYDGSAVDLDGVIRPFARLTAPRGVYFISGNHEEFSPDMKFIDAVARTGITVLNNTIVVKDGLQIIGVDYDRSIKPDMLSATLAKIDPTMPAILLKHVPNNINIVEQFPIQLEISGHTHDGQLWPLGYISARAYHGFDKGLKKMNELAVYTSVGVGTWGPPLRVGNRPEIVVITFE